MSERDHVRAAIDRWERNGHVDAETAHALRAEVDAHESARGRTWAQYAIAATGAILLLIAATVFVRWAWPRTGPGSHSIMLGGFGFAVLLLGMALERRVRIAPAAYLLQAAGLALLLMSATYSRRAWADASIGAIVFGIAVIAIPLVTAGLAIRRNPVMPAIHTAFGYAFLYVFLERATALETDTIIWILDAVAAIAIVLLMVRLRYEAHHDAGDWTLNAFVASLWSAGFLILWTSTGPLDLGAATVWPLNVWLIVVTALTLWGIHRAPPGLRRSWFGHQLALCILLGIVLGFTTALEALDLAAAGAALLVGAIGVAGLRYGVRHDARDAIAAACIALLSAAWYYGAETGGAIGTVAALLFSAALFFWLSTRLGGERHEEA